VSGNSPSPPSTVVDATFNSMEEVNELTRAIGREGEFRQLSKGRVTSRWRSLHVGSFALTSHRLDKRVHARLTPPKGCVSLAIIPPPYFMSVDGVEFGNGQALVVGANSEVDIVSPDETACKTLVLPECDFEASGQALFPRFRMPTNGGLTCIWQCPPSRWSALHSEVRGLLRNGSVSPEDLSHLLGRFLGLMAGEPEKRQREVCRANRSTPFIAKRAQEYIEDHYRYAIRMEDLCRFTGVSLRTLQRSFSEYFQVSPAEYIKARRLNAARQALVAGDSSRDRVSQIAFDNGLTHLGRFSVNYRELFDESPKETLARGNLSKLRLSTFDLPPATKQS
jgi:AraC-like DNA-binding protein